MTRLLFSLFVLLAVVDLTFAGTGGTLSKSASASASLQIDQYCMLNIERDLFMHVTAGDFTNCAIPISDATFVDVAANFNFVLVCPTTVKLTRTGPGAGGPYYPSATVNLLTSPAPITYDANYQYLHLPRGAYNQDISLQLEIDKQWTSADLAGTYAGTITLSINPGS